MRNLISFTAIFLSALLLISGCRRKEPAQIDNAAIVRKAIAGQLNKKPDELTTEDYEKTTELVLYGTQVSDLTSIKALINLQWLSIIGTAVSDLTPIKELNKLQVLYFSGTKVSDLTPIKELKGLKMLELSGKAVSNEQVAELKKALPKLRIIR
jgi:Leucine-rich repeat (LRR) protein